MASTISSVILKIASRCNLNCSYCYVYNHEDRSYLGRPKFIPDDVFDAVLRRICEYCEARPGHTMSVVYHGGEPMLMPPGRFERLTARLRSELGVCLRRLSMQTNATLIDSRWADIFLRHDVSVGVSLDGPPEVHDAARVDHLDRGSYAATMRGVDALRRAGIAPEVLCVINPRCSGLEAYRHFRREGIDWMTFLLPDVSHDNKARFYDGLGHHPVADYLIPIFDEWYAEDDPRVYVGIFWDLLKRMLGGRGVSDCFGNPLMNYMVVETDGSIEALDALRVCDEGIARSGLNVLRNGFDELASAAPLMRRLYDDGVELSAQCRICSQQAVCGGGYLPHRYSRARGFDNPSVWCDDLKRFIGHMAETVSCPPRSQGTLPEAAAEKPTA